MKQNESKGCLKPSHVPGSALSPLPVKGGCSEEGPNEIKSQTRTLLETINTQHGISYNSH